MRSPPTPILAVALILLVGVPVALAQAPNDDPSAGGTTGLFMVPRASTLQPGSFSIAGFFSAIAREEGDTSIETIGLAGGFAFGATERLEIFASFEPQVSVHRNFHVERATRGGIPQSDAAVFAPSLNDHPFASTSNQDGVGDLRFGAKYKVAGDPDGYNGFALAGIIKFPTADDDAGVGTGEFDVSGFGIGSVEAAEIIGVNGYLGGTYRGDPEGVDLSSEFNWGAGIQVPTRFWLQGIFEIAGTKGALDDGDDWAIIQAGVRFTHETGLAVSAAGTYSLSFDLPSDFEDLPVRRGGGFAMISYSSSRAEPVVFEGIGPQPLPPVNRPPTISCRAERTSVRQGESVRLFATVNDPDSDPLTVTWSVSAGTVSPRTGEQVTWNSRGVQPGAGPINATVSDGYGGSASCELRVTVTAPPPPPRPTVLNFTCSEFPSGSTRIDNRCKAVLDDVALQMRQNPQATALITGHSDSVGSDDVNQRMSQERADNARAYLVETHGIDASRITTRSAGSSQPVADNATATGRAQNRRIEIVVTIPPG